MLVRATNTVFTIYLSRSLQVPSLDGGGWGTFYKHQLTHVGTRWRQNMRFRQRIGSKIKIVVSNHTIQIRHTLKATATYYKNIYVTQININSFVIKMT